MKFRHSYAMSDAALKGAGPFADTLPALAPVRVVAVLTVLVGIGVHATPYVAVMCVSAAAKGEALGGLRISNVVRRHDGYAVVVETLHLVKTDRAGASDGLDERDSRWTGYYGPPLMPLGGTDFGGVALSRVDGALLWADVRPLNSLQSVRLELSIWIQGETTVELSNSVHYLRFRWTEWSGFSPPITNNKFGSQIITLTTSDGNTHDIRQIIEENDGVVTLPNLSGVFESEVPFMTATLTFASASQPPDPPAPDPPAPDPIGSIDLPPTTPIKESTSPYSQWHVSDPANLVALNREFDGKTTLFVYHYVDGVLNARPNAVALCLSEQSYRDFGPFNSPLNTDYWSVDPIIYSETPISSAVRTRGSPNTLRNAADMRYIHDNPSFVVTAAFETSQNIERIAVPGGRGDYLLFAYPVSSLEDTLAQQRFSGKTPILTFNSPDSPRWDIHKVVEERDGVIELLPTKSSYEKGETVVSVTISFGPSLEDVNGDGVVDQKDYEYAFGRLGFEGTSSADIWSEQYGLGIPDGKVTQGDLDAVASAIANR